MNKHDCQETEDDGHQRRQQQPHALGLRVCGQATDGKNDGGASEDVNDDGHTSASAGSLEGGSISLLARVGEVVDLFLQRLALRLKFTYLLLERRVLRLKLDNLSERNRQLELRLLCLRRWHVQYPSVDETAVSAVEGEFGERDGNRV